jgi:hypothetical protein
MGDGSYQLVPTTASVTALKGCIAVPATTVTLEEMEAVVADAAADRTVP